MITDHEGIERFSLSTDVHKFIERIKQKINFEDAMVLGIITGGVGSGKSVLAQHWGYAIDPTFTDIDRICFDKEEFITAVRKNRKAVIVADEGISLFFSRGSMTKEGRLITELMAQVRQKNLCILVCVPQLLSVDKMILKQANFVAHVEEGSKMINGRRVTIKGNAHIFPDLPGDPYKTRLIQYLKMKERSPLKKFRQPYPWCQSPGNPIGETFKKPWYPAGEEAYRKKKESILDKYDKKEEKKPKKVVTSAMLLRQARLKAIKKKMLKEGYHPATNPVRPKGFVKYVSEKYDITLRIANNDILVIEREWKEQYLGGKGGVSLGK